MHNVSAQLHDRRQLDICIGIKCNEPPLKSGSTGGEMRNYLAFVISPSLNHSNLGLVVANLSGSNLRHSFCSDKRVDVAIDTAQITRAKRSDPKSPGVLPSKCAGGSELG